MTCIHQIHQKIDFPILNTLFYAAYITAKQTHKAGRKQIVDKASLRKERVWKSNREAKQKEKKIKEEKDFTNIGDEASSLSQANFLV